MVHSLEKHIGISSQKNEEIRKHTLEDPILKLVKKNHFQGWNNEKYSGNISVYYTIRNYGWMLLTI